MATELRGVVETWEDDPERLDEVRARRQLLHELTRKYGEGVAGVLAFADEVRGLLRELDVGRGAGRRSSRASSPPPTPPWPRPRPPWARPARRAAPDLARAVEKRLQTLAMAQARLEVTVADPDPGDDVTFLLGANPGEAVLPLAKVASGGELARAMLALRLVLTDAPPTMVFDEVDAGMGGEAAQAVGRALAEVAERHQVLVVTHLAQVAAYAAQQLGVRKEVSRGSGPWPHAAVLDDEARVVELARMLSGRPGLGHGPAPCRGAPRVLGAGRRPLPGPGHPAQSAALASVGRRAGDLPPVHWAPWSTVERCPRKRRA